MLMLRRLIQQAASVAGVRIVGAGLGVAVSIVLARAFGTEALGVYSYCVALMMLASVPISNGWAGILLRSVAKQGRIDAISQAMLRYGVFGALGLTILAAVMGYAVLEISRTEIALALQPVALLVVVLLSLALLADQFSALRTASLRGIDRPALAQLPETVLRPAFLIAGIVAVWLVLGPDSLPHMMVGVFGAVALAALLSAIFGQWILSHLTETRPLRIVDPATRRTWFSSAAALAGSAGLVQLNGQVDLLLLGTLRGVTEVGQYRAALQIATLANFGYMALNMLAGQRFAKFLAHNDVMSIKQTATYLSRLALLLAIPVPVILATRGELVFVLLFGPGFEFAALPALIVTVGFCFSAMVGMAHTLLVMSHGEFIALRLTVGSLVINILVCLVLIPPYGLLGAAVSNVIASGLWNFSLWFFAHRRTGIDTSALGRVAIAPSKH